MTASIQIGDPILFSETLRACPKPSLTVHNSITAHNEAASASELAAKAIVCARKGDNSTPRKPASPEN